MAATKPELHLDSPFFSDELFADESHSPSDVRAASPSPFSSGLDRDDMSDTESAWVERTLPAGFSQGSFEAEAAEIADLGLLAEDGATELEAWQLQSGLDEIDLGRDEAWFDAEQAAEGFSEEQPLEEESALDIEALALAADAERDALSDFEWEIQSPAIEDETQRYDKNEKEISRCQQGPCRLGHLPADVLIHPRGLLIADFGVGWSGIKQATKQEKLLQDWLRTAKSDLDSMVLRIHGYSDSIGEEKNNAELRQKRAQRVHGLLDADLQSRVVFTGPARAEEYVADNKTVEGRAKNRSVVIELLRVPPETIEVTGTAPKPPPPKPPQPKPTQSFPLTGTFKYSWKGKKHRIAKRGHLEFYAEPEVESTVTVNATGKELYAFAAKWEKGKGPGGELDIKHEKWFVPELKIEKDKEGFVIALKKELETLGGKLAIKPHLQLSREILKIEAIFLKFIIPIMLFGQKVKIEVEPKITIIVKVDVWKVIKDRGKEKVKNWLEELLEQLLKSVGRGLLGSLAKKALAALIGGVLVKLFLTDPPTTPITAPPDDVEGKDLALMHLRNTPSAAQILQDWANPLRREYAKAFADTLLELTREKWQDRLAQLHSLTLNGYKGLPARSASPSDWMRWATTQKALQTISIELPMDAFGERFRWFELMLMFAVAAWILGRIKKPDVDQALGIALQQARAAGMAAAAQYVNSRMVADTFTFIDATGKLQRANGMQQWDAIAALVRSSRLTDDQIRQRLAPLGLEQLSPALRVV